MQPKSELTESKARELQKLKEYKHTIDVLQQQIDSDDKKRPIWESKIMRHINDKTKELKDLNDIATKELAEEMESLKKLKKQLMTQLEITCEEEARNIQIEIDNVDYKMIKIRDKLRHYDPKYHPYFNCCATHTIQMLSILDALKDMKRQLRDYKWDIEKSEDRNKMRRIELNKKMEVYKKMYKAYYLVEYGKE